jgi:hypothetical protein
MLTILVILAVVLTVVLATAAVASLSDGGLLSWLAIDSIVRGAVEIVVLLLKCLE